jgi:hypothetical protein
MRLCAHVLLERRRFPRHSGNMFVRCRNAGEQTNTNPEFRGKAPPQGHAVESVQTGPPKDKKKATHHVVRFARSSCRSSRWHLLVLRNAMVRLQWHKREHSERHEHFKCESPFFVLKGRARPKLVTLIEARLLSCIFKHIRALGGATLCVFGYTSCTCRLLLSFGGCRYLYVPIQCRLLWLFCVGRLPPLAAMPLHLSQQTPLLFDRTVSEKGGQGLQNARAAPVFVTVSEDGRPKVAKGPGRLPCFTVSEEGRPKGGSRTLPFRRTAGQGLQRARGGSHTFYSFGGGSAKGCKEHTPAPVLHRFGGGPAKGCKRARAGFRALPFRRMAGQGLKRARGGSRT